MTELDRLYEDIERLLEGEPTRSGNTVEVTPENEEKMVKLAQDTNKNKKTTWQYRGIGSDSTGQKYIFSKTTPNKQNPKLNNKSWGYYSLKNGTPHIADYQPNQRPTIKQPYNPQNTQKALTLSGTRGLTGFKKNSTNISTGNSTFKELSSVFNSSTDMTAAADKAIDFFNNIDNTVWETGEWMKFCDVREDNYYYLKNITPEIIRFSLNTKNKITPYQLHGAFSNENEETLSWYLVGDYEPGKGWFQVVPIEKIEDKQPTGQTSLPDISEKDIVEEDITDEAQEILNTDTQLNYRLKSVIDSPQIQQQIDASPNGINYVGLNGDKISLVTMAESQILKEFNIPDFLLKLMEAKEVEISSLGSGGQTNLNVFLTPEIQEYLKTQKGNPTITKVMLGKDGLVWLMDDKNNPYLLDDMKVNDEVPAKDQQGNSFNVFINNGGAGGQNGNGQGGNGQKEISSDSIANANSNSQISNAITRDELVQVSEKIKGSFDKIKEGFFSAVGNNIYTISEIELGEVLNAEALKESVLREADSQDAAKTDAKSSEKKTPSKGSSEGVEFQVKLKIECNKIEEQEIPEDKYSDYLNKTAEYMAKSFTELKISTKKKSKDESGLSLTGNMATVNGYTFKAGNPSNFKMEQAEDKKASYIMNVTVICLKGSNNSSTFGNIMNKIGGVLASGSKAINKSNYVSV